MVRNNNTKSNLPLVSISCATYNHKKYIRDAIEGFLIQRTQFQFEILINDDASTDGTTDIIKEYEKLYPDIIFPIYQKENQYSKGISISPTFIWTRARGKYIAACEGDDYWTDPYKLQKQVDSLEANQEYGLVFSRFAAHDKDDKKIGESTLTPYTGHVFFAMQKKPIVSTVTSVIRKEAIMPLVERVRTENLGFVMDIWIWQQIALKWEIYGMDEVTAVYRVHPGGVTKRKDGSLGKMEHLLHLDVYNTFFIEHKIPVSFKNKMIISKIFCGAYFKVIYKKLSPRYAKIGGRLIKKKPWLLLGIFPFVIHVIKYFSKKMISLLSGKKHN